ncbi:single-strand binding protein [Candidatus Amoebophilus asiaticus 5a2]|uniref:Single-stranded DNA-binding protein n=1 Tax=Amoebophilus asiaticus (strain 5a2) TaxID=452471 RepID=B3EUI3_AMOA5|nr:single-stranded DNA-binding protein [Candidatus Amoebophilus asiaticus]ACE05602.1 single-strand binding protein [Candidatus Amoebophilus asiaticus 5a2]
MSGVNRVILLGNLGKDPEIRHLENGRARVSFTLATNEFYKNKEGEKVTSTEWHNVVLWSPLAEIAEKYLTKGKQVYIEGKLTNRSYTDKDGQAKYITEVVGQNLVLLGSKESEVSDIKERESFSIVEDEAADDLPF